MSRKYIKQFDNDNFVYPNNNLAEYDIEIVHDINNNSVTGSVINFSATTVTTSSITFSFGYTWTKNGAEPFILNNGHLSVLSVHCFVNGQQYYKPWNLVDEINTSDVNVTTVTGIETFTITPGQFGLGSFSSGTYYFEFRFIGHRAIYPVCASLNITTATPTPTPTPTATAGPTFTPTPTPTPTATGGPTFTPTPTPTVTPTGTPTSTPTVTPTPTALPACVTSVSFEVDSAGDVRYVTCCGNTIYESFGIGPQVINECLQYGSLFQVGASISFITYGGTPCSCITPTPTLTSTPTATPTVTPTATPIPECVISVGFEVDGAGEVRYVTCCGITTYVSFGIGPQVILDCLQYGSLFATSATISFINYSVSSCTCITPTPTLTATPTPTPSVTPTPTATGTPTPTPTITSTPTVTPTATPTPECVISVGFEVDGAGDVRYVTCCGNTVYETFGIGPQVINDCMQYNSLFAVGATISFINYSVTPCSCITPTPTLTATPTPTPTSTPSPTPTVPPGINSFAGCGYGNSTASACNDASINNRTLYSDCTSGTFGVGCFVYVDTFPNALTGYSNVFMNGASWDINSSTGVVTAYSSEQC